MRTVTGETPYPSRRAFCCGLGAALALNVELSPSDDEKLLRFRDPHGIVVELKSA
jgi:hypothetical protein